MKHTIETFVYRLWPWFKGATHNHDRFLVLSLTGFNFCSGWEQLLLRNETRNWR